MGKSTISMVIFNSKLLVYQRVMMSKSIVRFLRYQLGDFNVFFALLNGLPSCNVAMEKKDIELLLYTDVRC